MSFLQIVVLAIVQGITEFLPISSSAHLILVPRLTDWPDQGVMMDVGVHLGTLGAVMLYFRTDVGRLFNAFWQMLTLKQDYDRMERRLFLALILSTIPIIIFGGLAAAFDLNDLWRTLEVIGWTSILFGLLLYVLDMRAPVTKKITDMRYGHALIMGFAQVLSIIPGTSRAGITMTAARGMGFSRTEAARFSMLMSIPTIIAAGSMEGVKLAQSGDFVLGLDILLGAGLSFLAALVAIAALMKWLERASMTPFVVYRVMLGAALLVWAYA
ncbi:undecaprenyl-diphosphate phosphatase [Luteithermobacter gelatinilyticus]|uniref:undecaprenyl-diphosphate phosphatase n=1 Tax=Luteithermobacter gelatinilyticus TaxID=2582913 RepID=UPI001105CE4C|nr:undecaprenyl-diphosphate phosphatase [Luteithermobacter gelatinilyticus]